MGLPISTNQKSDNYNLMLAIFNLLKKIVYDKLVKVIINTFRLIKIMFNMIIKYHGLLNLF